ncbi:putative Fungal N-terminal domain-containing protein [Seiridium cardinale]|uniref:Fungal N-terminal domain-containing protein n=1 Tax=Seiridium cardinale TaxID=138064 RepID=A0ABR2XD74_9PEZI
MAEVLGLASSIIAVLDLSAKVVKQCKAIIETARDAPKDLRNILVEVSSLKSALENLQFLTKIDCEFAEEISNQNGLQNAVKGCGETLVWTWKEATARKLISELLQYKTTITLGLLTQTSREVHETKVAVEEIHEFVTGDQRYKICAWLETTNPSVIHNFARKNYESHTGEWVLRLPPWKPWLEGHGSARFIWIYGIPGAGKTVLASFLIETCRSYCEGIGSTGFVCIYYYCSYLNNQDETTPLLRWLVSQISRTSKHVSKEIYDIYEMNHQPGLDVLKEALRELLCHMETVYLFVDAVDESQPRDELLCLLEDFVTDPRFRKIRLLVTSRNYHDIDSALRRLSLPVSMSNDEVDKDIRIFVTAQLEKRFTGWRSAYIPNVSQVLVRKAQGMFRLAFCHVDIISRRRSVPEIYQSLESLPQTIEDTYETISLDIEKADWPLARVIFYWIFANDKLPGGTPIPVDTLLSLMSRSAPGFNGASPKYTKQDIHEICGCLITVASTMTSLWNCQPSRYSQFPNGNFESARCAHYTVVEYLFSDQIRQSKAAFFSLSEADTIDTFLGTVLDVASKITLDSLNPKYWATFEDYCARAAWLATFTWESYIVQRPELWSSLTRIWLSSPCYFQRIGEIYQASGDPDFVKRRSDFLIEYTDVSNLPTVQELLARTFVSLVLNSSLVLAQRLLTENGTQVIDTPVYFGLPLLDTYSDMDPSQIFLGSAIEAIASTGTHAVAEPLKEVIPLLIGQVDKTRLALICIGTHFCPQCPSFETDDCCKAIQPLLQYTETSETLTYSMTPLQLAVYCYDYGATKALLENGIEPNVLGARHGEPLPIHLYKIEDWGSASPLHIVKHAGYGLQMISKSLLFLKRRQFLGDKIKDLLIGYGARDFVRSPST